MSSWNKTRKARAAEGVVDALEKADVIDEELADKVEDVIDKFRNQLSAVEDRTDKIVNHNLKTHRRTSDIHEWKTKLDMNYINKETKNKHIDKFDQYDEFLISHGIQ